MSNIVAIIGRPNVGKSTLFNRLTESRSAIVNETPGTTRDRHYGKCEWGGREFTIIDTGGYISGSDDVFESEINKQVKMAVEESDIILFMVDVTAGITNMDESVVKLLRRSKKKVILIANKADNHERLNAAVEFYALGLGEIFAVSAVTGSGTGELLDEVVAHLNPDREVEEDDIPRFAVVGRPNVGKSSLVNALLGVERNIVTPVAGTTRDTINSRYSQFGFDFWLVDTAGLRKKGKVTDDIEFYSVLRTIRAIEDCDVCLLMLDATQGIESQDLNVFGLAERNHKGLVILVNKWDMVEEKDTMSTERYKELIYERIAPFRDVPIIFTSVTGKQRVLKALEAAVEVHENRKRRIKTHELNEVMLDIINRNPPPALKGKYIKVKFVTQLPGRYPSFAFFCNMPQYVKEPYKRFLENQIRANFNFSGSPMNIFFRQK